ncbi:FliM/FliN family flagellar motor switch protein [Lyticum sinuosum]|uniref:Flagellar motor switch protein FliM n=1 Tax=Lyticum sinuosum TaxID=1332059 RepID=A0AAE5AGN2_9RICK|nr:FliM/FliN family flagellar motor switch protein [Lyticum sinuosum]MDZ5760937.1 Flagellar motor switch protein FliM [Lyticum sinuosum]
MLTDDTRSSKTGGNTTKKNYNQQKNSGILEIINKQSEATVDSIPGLRNIMYAFFEKISTYVRNYAKNDMDLSILLMKIVKWSHFSNSEYIKKGVGVSFTIPQLHSECVLIYHSDLVYCLLENMFGGNPDKNPLVIKERQFSSMEATIIEDISVKIFSGFIEAMSGLIDLSFKINKVDTNSEYIMYLDDNDNVIHMAIRFTQNNKNAGILHFIMPFNAINYIRNLLAQVDKSNEISSPSDEKWQKSMENIINSSNVILRAEMNNTSLSLHNISKLTVGDTIIINRDAEQDSEIKISGYLVGYGKLGKIKNNLAIQVTSIFNKDLNKNDENNNKY